MTKAMTKANNKKIQRLQNRALRIIYDKHDSPEELHIKARLTAIQQRADKQLLNLMYQRSLTPSKYPQINNQQTATRTSEKVRFEIPRPNSERFKNFPHYRGVQLWDTLNVDTQRAPSYLYFKSRIPRDPDFVAYPVR